MEFDKPFESHLTSEWRQQYINYEEMNLMIRAALRNTPHPKDTIEYEVYCLDFKDEFFTRLTDELNRVNDFYEYKMAEARRKHVTLKLKLLYIKNQNEDAGAVRGLPPLSDQPRSLRKLDRAYTEFYFSLVLLNNFQQLNYMGFYRLSEKCNKYFHCASGNRWVQKYLDVCSISLDGPELRNMIVEVENLYTHYIADGDRAKAMDKLRVPPLGQPTAPVYVFSSGVFLGLFLVSIVVCIVSAYNLYSDVRQFSLFVRLFRGPFGLLVYGFCLVCNLYVWQRVGINHVLIFDLNPRNHSVPIKLLCIISSYGYICMLAMLLFIHHTEFGVTDPLYFPLICLAVPIVFLINPVPILNFPARMWILQCFGRILAAPFCFVTFVDFWLADQLTSTVQCSVDFYQMIRFHVRYALNRSNSFDFEPDYAIFALRCLPAWFRVAQCIRRYFNSREKRYSYLVNAFSYFSILLVVIMSTVQMETSHEYNSVYANPWTWGYIVSSVISTLFTTAWELLQDYGLFKVWKGKNVFLRERLIYPRWFYFFAIIADFSIRLFWIMELYLTANNLLLPYYCKTLSSICEIQRRFIWNFLRLENEHLYNCGNFRAHRDIFVSALSSRDELLVKKQLAETERNAQPPKENNNDHNENNNNQEALRKPQKESK